MHRRLTMNYAKIVAEIAQACNKVIDDNKQWAKDNDCDIEMSDSIKGWDDMARDILAIIERDKE